MNGFFFISFLFLLGTPIKGTAQHKSHAVKSTAKEAGPTNIKFIEGIEIKMGVPFQPKSKPVDAVPRSAEPVDHIPLIECSNRIQFKYSQLLNCNVESITNLALFAFIDDWWATRYQYGGINKKGIDCSGFAGQLFTEVYSFEIPRSTHELNVACERVDRGQLAEGDLVFFNTTGGVSHVGIYLRAGYFVHSSTTHGVTINNLDDDYYNARFLGGGKLKHDAK